MRPGERYDCTRCKLRGVQREALCEKWCARARDENGNAPPLPAREILDRALSASRHDGMLLVSLVRPAVQELVLAAKQSRARGRLKKRLKLAGPVVSIAEAAEGLVRVEGKVRVLEPATTAVGRGHIAAFEWRTVVDVRASGVAVRRITTQRGSGRFLVDDGTGVALIDDAFMAFRTFKGRGSEPHEEGGFAVRDGTSVAILGVARRGPVDLPDDMPESTGYRERTLPLIFDGSSEEPLVVFATPNERDPTSLPG